MRKLKFFEFFKQYYKATDRKFSDKIIWGTKTKRHEQAWQKGRLMMSKLERKVLIVLQYISLLCFIVVSVIKPEIWFCSIIGIILFVLEEGITEFSLVRVMSLYFLLRGNTVYSKILCNAMIEDIDLSFLTKQTKKHINGYVCIKNTLFQRKYKAILKSSIEIFVVFKHSAVCLSIGKKRIKISENYANEEKLFSQISEEILNNI